MIEFKTVALTMMCCAMLFGVMGCAAPRYVHAVFFDIKEGTSDDRIHAQIDDAYALLDKISTVRKVESGRRDVQMVRDVNDQDFDIGLVVYFDDQAGLDVYMVDPRHDEYVEKHKDIWERARVFDFIAK